MAKKDDFKYAPNIDGGFDVFFGDLLLGNVYQEESAWYGHRWFAGDEKRTQAGGLNRQTVKPFGYKTRLAAAKRLAAMRSADIINYLDKQQASPEFEVTVTQADDPSKDWTGVLSVRALFDAYPWIKRAFGDQIYDLYKLDVTIDLTRLQIQVLEDN